VKRGQYKSWKEFEDDVQLVWSNAFTFNEDGSQVYEDAKILKTAFEKTLKEKKTELGEPTEPVRPLPLTILTTAHKNQIKPPTSNINKNQTPCPRGSISSAVTPSSHKRRITNTSASASPETRSSWVST
jgi:hypothetical protein